MQCNSTSWQALPGGFDTLKARWLFPSDNEWGIPDVPAAPLSAVPAWMAPYRTRIRSNGEIGRGGVHFFLDDYRFEAVWNHPHKALKGLTGWEVVCSPDFSLYRDHPRAIQVWNVYRNRWCNAFWAHHGLAVIPTVSWGAPESYAFAFAGVPQRSVVALGTVGTRWKVETEKNLFTWGWNAMLEAIDPVQVLVYGTVPEALVEQVNVKRYPTYWEGVVRLKRQYGR